MSFVGERFVGAVCGELVKDIRSLIQKAWNFSSSVRELQSDIDNLDPILQRIQSLNDGSDRTTELERLASTLKAAKQLLEKCSHVKKHQLHLKISYYSKIEKFQESIRNFCQVYLPLLTSRDLKQIINNMTDGTWSRGSSLLAELRVPPLTSEPAIGLDGSLRELKNRLSKEGKSVIVVSAPPGLGKTTLVLHLCHDRDVKAEFKKIIYVQGSEKPDVKSSLNNLLQRTGVSFSEALDEQCTINKLKGLLKEIGKQPLLVVLDNVWTESLIDHFNVMLPKYKILVTSVYRFPCYEDGFELKPLSDRDALRLFTAHAGPLQDRDFADIAEKIVKQCKGVPKVLKEVGGRLKGKKIQAWRSQCNSLVLGSIGEFLCLKGSLDALEITNKRLYECFLDLGSFPEDRRIRVSSIIDMWSGLYDLHNNDDGMKDLEELHNQNLLTLFCVRNGQYEAEGFYNEYFVSPNGILREPAIRESSKVALEQRCRLIIEMNANKDFESEQTLNARLLSISTDDPFSLSRFKMRVPDVEVFVLNTSSKDYVLPGFLDEMKKLKVLILLNHGSSHAKLCSLSLLACLENLERIRLEKISFPSPELTSIQLTSLRKISLVMCKISEALEKGPEDISRVLPNLNDIDLDYCDLERLPDWIFGVTNLKRLSITNCHTLKRLSEAIRHLERLETLRLNSCLELCELPEEIEMLRQLGYLDISGCSGLSKLPEGVCKLPHLTKLGMVKCHIIELPKSARLLRDVRVFCDEESARIWLPFESQQRNVSVEVKVEKPTLNWLREKWPAQPF